MSPPQSAWSELQQMLLQMTPQEAHQDFQKARDEIERLQREEKGRLQDPVAQARDEPTEASPPRKGVFEKGEPNSRENDVKKNELPFSLPLDGNVLGTNAAPRPERDWIYVVEEMPNISSYQVTLWPKTVTDTLPDSNSLDSSMQHTSQGNTLVSLHSEDAILFSAQFPGRLVEQESTNLVRRQSDCLSLRLQSRDIIDSVLVGNNGTSLEALQSLSCRYCDQHLLKDTKSIEKVLPLPKGYWDEITDYLICYNGVSTCSCGE